MLLNLAVPLYLYRDIRPKTKDPSYLDEYLERVANAEIAAMVANWKVWPIIQGVNFSIIPFQYRLPFQSTCSIGWNVFMSLLNAEYVPSPTLFF